MHIMLAQLAVHARGVIVSIPDTQHDACRDRGAQDQAAEHSGIWSYPEGRLPQHSVSAHVSCSVPLTLALCTSR